MELKKDLLNHFKSLKKAVLDLNGEAFLNVLTFIVELRTNTTIHRLYPLFVARRPDGGTAYAPALNDQAERFAGWRPRRTIKPFSFGKKLVFKDLVAKYGLSTPRYATAPDDTLGDVIIKKDISSFGDEIKGPFRRAMGAIPPLGPGEFYEEFTPGRIVKIWFWNDVPVQMEMKSMPVLHGDGIHTVEQLIQNLPRRNSMPINLQSYAPVLDFYGKSLTDVLPSGDSLLIDYRYTSVFCLSENMEDHSSDTFDTAAPGTEDELRKLGRELYAILVHEDLANSVYTVDAILDETGRLWYLEANSNPFVHPAVYPPMVKALVSLASETSIQTRPQHDQRPQPYSTVS